MTTTFTASPTKMTMSASFFFLNRAMRSIFKGYGPEVNRDFGEAGDDGAASS